MIDGSRFNFTEGDMGFDHLKRCSMELAVFTNKYNRLVNRGNQDRNYGLYEGNYSRVVKIPHGIVITLYRKFSSNNDDICLLYLLNCFSHVLSRIDNCKRSIFASN